MSQGCKGALAPGPATTGSEGGQDTEGGPGTAAHFHLCWLRTLTYVNAIVIPAAPWTPRRGTNPSTQGSGLQSLFDFVSGELPRAPGKLPGIILNRKVKAWTRGCCCRMSSSARPAEEAAGTGKSLKKPHKNQNPKRQSCLLARFNKHNYRGCPNTLQRSLYSHKATQGRGVRIPRKYLLINTPHLALLGHRGGL